jgi:hypothetical protein
MMASFSKVEKNVETLTGLSVEEIRRFSPEKLRAWLQQRKGVKLAFVSEFPVIGRGNILRDNIADSDMINRDIDKILN